MGEYEKFTFSFSIATATYCPLHDGYIPNTIVRHSDLQQSDWSINDEDDLRYIKNKTHGTRQVRGEPIYVKKFE